MKIIRATAADTTAIASLFDKYRQFYNRAPDLEGCHAYIKNRLTNDESIIFLAFNDSGEAVGFTQLYNSFCSVAMKPIVHLYDLYVEGSARRRGIGRALMEEARKYGASQKADRLILETGLDNINAQALYESIGYERESQFYTYNFEL